MITLLTIHKPFITVYVFCASICPQHIMREKWINLGMEDEELKPYVESSQDVLDPVRIGNIPKQTVDLREADLAGHSAMHAFK